jgi:hypothetical protein
MKTATSLKFITLAAVLGTAFSASVLAQTGPGPGPAPGVVPLMQGAGPGPGPGAGMGPGARGMRNMRYDKTNTPGWTLMTAQERTAHQNRMREVKTYEECKQVQAEHHTAMELRAKDKGVTLRAAGQNACDNMKARGFIK